MNLTTNRHPQAGFSLIELMTVLIIFLVVSSAVFGLINVAQARYRTEQQLLDALSGARIGLEIVTRDITRAGYPPANGYDVLALGGAIPQTAIAVPFRGMVGAVLNDACIVDTINPAASTCTIPSPYQLVLEADLTPEDGLQQVEWIYYRVAVPAGLAGTGQIVCTLYRAVSPKAMGGNPTAVGGTPLVEQVVNQNIGGGDVRCTPVPADPTARPVFRYVCAGAAPTCTPNNIAEVFIQLEARPSRVDIQTQQVQAITLRSYARPQNPAQ